ncbi:MAG: hypothetical protein K8T91_04615 [Planctomycetes bacterium]|nr:hypothetical protein [Planctomycetota bacterium]
MAEVVLIFAVFLVHAGLQPPAVNETNYLAKAKHYWNPQWCQGDLFLNSADPHAVFYWTCGWWTLWLPLATVAIVGRVLTYFALAWSWRRLSAAVAPGAWWSVLSAALMVVFTSRVHMAGEWVVGGFEAKGFAYALVFLALEGIVRGRWLRVWPLLGMATALHVLVGGWSIVAAGIVWLSSRSDPQRSTLRPMLPSIFFAVLIALVGIVPTLQLDYGTDRSIILRAAEIQVFHRLPHHLNPAAFFILGGVPTLFAWRFFALTVVCLGLWRRQSISDSQRRCKQFVVASLLIAAVGLLICEVGVDMLGARAETAWLLRFYWFRLADTMVPVGAALAIVASLAELQPRRPAWATAALALAMCVGGLPLVWETYERTTLSIPGGDVRMIPTAKRYDDWLEVCEAARGTKPGSVFMTPSGSQTFKWYAERPEVATWKEMPQDAASIVQWWNRLVDIHGPPGAWQPPTRLPAEQLRALGRAHGADYLLGPNDARIDLFCIYRNNSFAIYELGPPRS